MLEPPGLDFEASGPRFRMLWEHALPFLSLCLTIYESAIFFLRVPMFAIFVRSAFDCFLRSMEKHGSIATKLKAALCAICCKSWSAVFTLRGFSSSVKTSCCSESKYCSWRSCRSWLHQALYRMSFDRCDSTHALVFTCAVPSSLSVRRSGRSTSAASRRDAVRAGQ